MNLSDFENAYQQSLRQPGADESAFKGWYAGWAQKAGIDPDPDDPRHKYDYRAAFRAGVAPEISREDGRYHWPSQFKAPDHPNRYVAGVDTITGNPVNPGELGEVNAARPALNLEAMERAYQDSLKASAPKPAQPEPPGAEFSDMSDAGYGLSDDGPRMRLGDVLPYKHDDEHFLGYKRDLSGLAQAGEDVSRAMDHVATAPARVGVDLARLLWAVGAYPAKLLGKKAVLDEKSGKTVGEALYDDQLKGLKDLKEKITFVEEPYSDMALTAAISGGAGALMRNLGESARVGKVTAQALRQAGITEPLVATAAKSAASGVAGDVLVVNPSMAYLEKRLESSELSPAVKQTIAVTAPLLIGLVSGATIEAKIDRMLKNPLAIGFFESMTRAKVTPKEIVEKFKQGVEEDTELRGLGKLAVAETELKTAPGPQPKRAEDVREALGGVGEQGLGDELDQRLKVQPAGVKSAQESAEVFESAFRKQNQERMQAAAPKDMQEAIGRAVSSETGKSAEQSARDMLAEQELLLNDVYRKRVPEARRQAQEQPGLVRMLGDVAAGKVPSQGAAEGALYRHKVAEIEREANASRPLQSMDKAALIRARLQFDHAGRKDLVDIVQDRLDSVAALEKRRRAANAKGGETLRWRIDQMGGIDFLNFKGEAKDIPPMVRRSIQRKNGVGLDLAERTLRDEGWLDAEESLLSVLKYDAQALRRRQIGTDLDARQSHLTNKEREMKAQLAHEPEAPDGFDDIPGHLQADVAAGRMSMDEARAATTDKVKEGLNVQSSGETPFDDFFAAHEGVADRRGELGQLFDEALSGRSNKQRMVDYLKVDDIQAAAIKEKTGITVGGYVHSLDNYSVRHIMKQHGDALKELPRGQVPIAKSDIERLPEVVGKPDSIETSGKTEIGRDTIKYTRRLNGTVYVVEEVRDRRGKLVPVTMYKKAAAPDVAVRDQAPGGPPAQTSETFRSPDAETITNDAVDVNDATEPRKGGGGTTLMMHPSTVTGPFGGLYAGIDYDEESGEYRIDPKKALIGALAGAAAPVAGRRMMGLGGHIADKWDYGFAKPMLDKAKAWARGQVVLVEEIPLLRKVISSEDVEYVMGLNRSQKLGDMLRDFRRDSERAWKEAAELGMELAEIAPTKLEQKRLMQIIRGGVTASRELRVKAEKVREIFQRLRESLKEHKLLEYSRFDGLTRKERAKLRNDIAKEKSGRLMTEEAFLKNYGLSKNGFDQEFVPDPPKTFAQFAGEAEPPAHATEQVPLKAYGNGEKPVEMTAADWAREKLHDHYHFASAEEYAPVFYDKHEGLPPKAREAVQDEIRRLKVKSRRGNPEGEPVLERQIADMEKLLAPGKQGRADLRKARMQLNQRYSHRRLEIPEDVQKLMGVIEEAPFPVAKMAGVQRSDILKAKLFEEIEKNSEWVFHTKIKNPKTGEMEKVYGGEPPSNFVAVEDKKQWGVLAGQYVRKDVWNDLREVDEWRGAFIKLWDQGMGLWKTGKVVLNPASHARNFISNMILAYLGGVNPTDLKTYGAAVKALKKGVDDPHYKEAADWGLFSNTFVSSEITKLRDELDSLRDSKSMKTWIKRAAQLPSEAYEGNEKFFKLALFIKQRKAGATVEAAARNAEEAMFNYADIPPWVKSMRRWVSPFFTFTYKAVPRMAEMAIRRPHKVAAVAAAMYGMEEIAKHSLGISDEEAEEQREMLPDWQKRRWFGAGPHTQVLMPFRDAWGNNLYLDTSYILPFGNASEKWGQSALPLSDLMPTNPLFQLGAEILTNRDSFTGREIYNEVLDGTAAVMGKYLEHAWREAAPSLAPGGFGWNKLKTGLKNTLFGADVRDWADRPMELSTAALSALAGIKLTPAAERQLKMFELREREKIGQEVGKEIGRLRVKLRRNEIDDGQFAEEAKRLEELKRRLLMERQGKQ